MDDAGYLIAFPCHHCQCYHHRHCAAVVVAVVVAAVAACRPLP